MSTQLSHHTSTHIAHAILISLPWHRLELMVFYNKPVNCTSWDNYITPVWYIGPSLYHYRLMQCYITATDIVSITDTLQYIPKSFAFLKTSTEDYLSQAIGDITSIIQDTPKTLPFLFYGDATNNKINHIAHTLQLSKSRPQLPILTLPPMVP